MTDMYTEGWDAGHRAALQELAPLADAPAEYFRRHYQTAPTSHLSEIRNQQPDSACGARHNTK